MAVEFIVNCDAAYRELLVQISEDYQEHHYLKGKYTTSAKRSLDQNAMIHSMNAFIAKEQGFSPKEQKAILKLDFGLDILRRDEERFEEIGKLLDSLAWNRPLALKVIDPIDITSAMNREQGAEFITTIMDYYPQHGLVWPDYIINGK